MINRADICRPVRDAVYRFTIISPIFRLCLFDIDIHSATDEIPSVIDIAGEGPFKAFIFLFPIQCAEPSAIRQFYVDCIRLFDIKVCQCVQEFTSLYFEAHFILLRLCRIKHFAFIDIIV